MQVIINEHLSLVTTKSITCKMAITFGLSILYLRNFNHQIIIVKY